MMEEGKGQDRAEARQRRKEDEKDYEGYVRGRLWRGKGTQHEGERGRQG